MSATNMGKRIIIIERDGKKEVHTAVSLDDTKKIVVRIASQLQGGDVIALSGNLGAGKTTFVQMLGEKLGVKEQITSPTFVLMKLYSVLAKKSTIRTLCHIDAYRLTSARDLEAIGADDYIGKPHVLTCIEWPEKVKDMIPKDAIHVDILIKQ